jgi:hypothetical protein
LRKDTGHSIMAALQSSRKRRVFSESQLLPGEKKPGAKPGLRKHATTGKLS